MTCKIDELTSTYPYKTVNEAMAIVEKEKDKIHFNLDTRPPQSLSATYKNVTRSVFVEKVPDIVVARFDGRILSTNEEIAMASKYLKSLLLDEIKHSK